MTAPWLINPDVEGPALRRSAIRSATPGIVTDRLVLRAPRLEDWPVLEPIWTTDRAVHIGGPMEAEDGWLDFNQMVASWLLRGFGPLTVTLKETGAVLGIVSLDHEWGDPKPELGWLLTEEAEGRGYAEEAARAISQWAVAELGRDGVEIYLDRDHEKSVRIARAIGAVESGSHPLDPDRVAVYRLPPDLGAMT